MRSTERAAREGFAFRPARLCNGGRNAVTDIGRLPRAGYTGTTAETRVASMLWFGGRGGKARKRGRKGTSIFAPHLHKFSVSRRPKLGQGYDCANR
jgi:hypothetical protein